MNARTIALMILIAVIAYRAAGINKPDDPNVPPPVDPSVPSVELQTAVAPIKQLAATNHETAEKMAALYEDVADVLVRDATVITTTGQIRRAISRAETLFAQRTSMVSGLPGFSAAFNAVMASQLGLEDTSLDAAKRQKAVDVLIAVAWALEG